MSKSELFNSLLKNFMDVVPDVEAVIVSDDEGLIIAAKLDNSLKEKTLDNSLEEKTDSISVLSSLVNPILERIRYEFSFKKWGTASFETEDSRILFVSVKDNATVSIILNTLASIDKTAPYAYFLAEKCAQILTEDDINRIQIYIPNFEYDERQEFDRLKNQIYQMRLARGEYKFKFIIVGDHAVGKTSIVMRFVENRFSTDYRATIGLNILTHNYKFLNTAINLMIWDIGAQKFFRRVRKTYYQGAHSAFLVFDLTNVSSFENLENWYDELKGFISKDIPVVVVGNKTDLSKERKISYQEGVSLANKLKASYIETSAKTGENVEDAFSLISYHYIVKSQLDEENIVKTNLISEINKIINVKGKLILSFIGLNKYWNPALQLFTEFRDLGEMSIVKNEELEKIYSFNDKVIIKNYINHIGEIVDSDGVLFIFDARNKKSIDLEWRNLVINGLDKINENTSVLIGLRTSEDHTQTAVWSRLIEEFNLNEYLEKKMIPLLFFKITTEYRLELLDQFNTWISTISSFL